MYVKMLKRRLQEVTGKDDPFSTSRYLAERMAEDMIEKVRISPVKKAKLMPTAPEEKRRPKRPRPYVDPWARDLNLGSEYDPNRLTKVQRRSEEHTNVAMDFISAKLQNVALADQGKEENTCKALALYQPSPLQRLTHPNSVMEVPSEALLSSFTPTVAELSRSSRIPLPVPDMSKALILYPVPENTLREALKKLVDRKDEGKREMEYESSPRIEEIFDDEDLMESPIDEEEEGDGMMVTDRGTSQYDDDFELQVEELNSIDEEEEEEEELITGRKSNTSSYWVSTPSDGLTDNLIYEDDADYDRHASTTTSTTPFSTWYSPVMAPPPTPLATSYSSFAPFLNQNQPQAPSGSTDMNSFLSKVHGKLLNEQQRSSSSFDTTIPFEPTPLNYSGIESIDG